MNLINHIELELKLRVKIHLHVKIRTKELYVLELMSLKNQSRKRYKLHSSNYKLAGRVLANMYLVPNAKIKRVYTTEEMLDDAVKTTLYHTIQ